MQAQLPPANCEVAKICREILEREPAEKVSVHMAYLAIQEKFGFNELRHKKEPLMSEEVAIYYKLSEEQRKSFVTKFPDFWKSGAGGKWLNDVSSVRSQNDSSRRWLLQILKILNGRQDHINAKKVSLVLSEFPESKVTTATRGTSDEVTVLNALREMGGTVTVAKPGYRRFDRQLAGSGV